MGMLEYTPILICLMIIALYIVIVKQEKARRDLKALDMKIADSFENFKEMINNQNLEIYDKLKIVSAGIADSTKIDDKNFANLNTLIIDNLHNVGKTLVSVDHNTNQIINNTKIIDNALNAFESNVKDFSEWQKVNYSELFSKLKDINLTQEDKVSIFEASVMDFIKHQTGANSTILTDVVAIRNKIAPIETAEIVNVSTRTPARKRGRLGK